MSLIENYKIAIFTRSANYLLFKMSSNTIKLPFKHYRFTFTTAHGYLYKILKHKIDYAINIDEDAFVINNDALLSLLEYCITERIVNCGLRDGGVLPIRYGNPIVTNPFFNIMDVRTIRREFSLRTIERFKGEMIDYEFFINNIDLPHKYNLTSEYEPFYPFSLWLNTNFKVLYLNAVEHEDGISTILLNHKGEEMLYHSWYSRNYGNDQFHTDRINKLYEFCNQQKINLNIFQKGIIWIERNLNESIIPLILPVRRALLKLLKR